MVVGGSPGAVVGVAGVVLVGDVQPAIRISAMQVTTINRVVDEGKCIRHCLSETFILFCGVTPYHAVLNHGRPGKEG